MHIPNRIGLCVILLFTSVFFASAQDTAPEEGVIIYDSDASGRFEVYRFHLATGDITRLIADDETVSYAAVYNAEQTRIALSIETDSESFTADVFTINPDGTDLQRLTNTPFFTGVPDWSPDGTHIIFNEEDANFNSDIYLMAADGSNRVNLTNTPNSSEWEARFSPDGERIVFASDADGINQIFVMAADGSNVQSLTADLETNAFSPSWSPDGAQIAFTSGSDVLDVYVMDADGENLTNLTNHTLSQSAEVPIWSPDGNYIAYSLTQDDYESYNLYVLELATGEKTQLDGTTAQLILLSDWIIED